MRLIGCTTLSLLAIVSLALLTQGNCHAETPPTSAETEQPAVFLDNWRLVDQFHLVTGASLLGFSERLDRFFSRADQDDYMLNNSHMQAQVGTQVDSDGKVVILQRVLARIDLPRTQQRLSVYFDEVSEDQDQLSSTLSRRTEANLRFGLTTGLRYVIARSPWYLLQYKIGARLLPEWRRFSTLSGHLHIPLGKFLLQPSQHLFWRDPDGYGETTRIDLDFPITDDALLRWRAEGTISERTAGLDYRMGLYFIRQLAEKKGYDIVLEGRGISEPDVTMVEYLTGFVWRQRIHGDWLFIELGSNLLMRKERDFSPVPALVLMFEGNFGGGTKPAGTPTNPPKNGNGPG